MMVNPKEDAVARFTGELKFMELKFKALPGPWGDWESEVTVAIVRCVILKPVIISFLILNIHFCT